MNKRPTILIIENSIDVTGALKSITRIASTLKNDYTFIFILPKGSKARVWVEERGFENIIELKMIEISKRPMSLLMYFPLLILNAFKVKKIIRQHHVDVVHVNDLYNMIMPVINLVGFSVPYICHVRFLPETFPRWIFDSWLKVHNRYARKIVVVSSFLKNKLPAYDKIVHISNELPIKERYPAVSLIEKKDKYIFLYLANYIQGKGQDYALEAFHRVQEKLPDWRMRFIGSDMGLNKNKLFKMDLMKRASHLGIADKIEWRDFAIDVEKEYKSADIVLVFSESESFSLACLEALYYGMPLIATDCGGPAEIVDNGVSGILVANRDRSQMEAAMISLAGDIDMRRRLAANARSISRSRFSVEETSLKIGMIYQENVK